jgi:hypothetical protein
MMATGGFEPVPGPFGGVDEEATMRALVFVGGVGRAERLRRLSADREPVRGLGGRIERRTAEVCTAKARREGLGAEEAAARLAWQEGGCADGVRAESHTGGVGHRRAPHRPLQGALPRTAGRCTPARP